jgi:hypothetical protein
MAAAGRATSCRKTPDGASGRPVAGARGVKWPFAWLALGVGLLLALVLLQTGAMGPEGGRSLPLLTQLILTEFGFFLAAIGAATGIRRLMAGGFNLALFIAVAGCGLLMPGFLWLGLRLWPGGGA